MGLFFFNRNGQYFRLMTKFDPELFNVLPRIDRFFYLNWSIFHFDVQILSVISDFWTRIVFPFYKKWSIFQFPPPNFVWFLLIFWSELADFLIGNGQFYSLLSKFCLTLVDSWPALTDFFIVIGQFFILNSKFCPVSVNFLTRVGIFF